MFTGGMQLCNANLVAVDALFSKIQTNLQLYQVTPSRVVKYDICSSATKAMFKLVCNK